MKKKKKEEEESMGSGYWNMVPEPRKEREGRRNKKKRSVWVPATGIRSRSPEKEEKGVGRIRRGEYGFRLLEYGAGAQKRKRWVPARRRRKKK